MKGGRIMKKSQFWKEMDGYLRNAKIYFAVWTFIALILWSSISNECMEFLVVIERDYFAAFFCFFAVLWMMGALIIFLIGVIKIKIPKAGIAQKGIKSFK